MTERYPLDVNVGERRQALQHDLERFALPQPLPHQQRHVFAVESYEKRSLRIDDNVKALCLRLGFDQDADLTTLVTALGDGMRHYRRRLRSAGLLSSAAGYSLVLAPVSVMLSAVMRREITEAIHVLKRTISSIRSLIESRAEMVNNRARMYVGLNRHDIQIGFAQGGLHTYQYEVSIVVDVREVIVQTVPAAVPNAIARIVSAGSSSNENIPVAVTISGRSSEDWRNSQNNNGNNIPLALIIS